MKIVWRWPKILGCTKTLAWQFKFFWCSGWQDIAFISYSVSTLTSCDPLKHSRRDKRNLTGTFRQPSRGMPVVLVTRRHYANVDTTNPQPARSQPPKPSRHHADTMFTLEPRSGQTVIPPALMENNRKLRQCLTWISLTVWETTANIPVIQPTIVPCC